MKKMADLIHGIALSKVILKYETLREIPKESDYRISGTIQFHETCLKFLNNKEEVQLSINYHEIIEIKSHKGIHLRGLDQPFGEFQSLIVQFRVKDGTFHGCHVMTEIYLNEQDLKVEKSPAPSLEKTLSVIYGDYKKIDKKRPDFPEYDI